MKFPTLSFELEIIKTFLSTENKFNWLTKQFTLDYNIDVQLAIVSMIGFALLSLYIVLDAERFSDHLPGKPKRLFVRILFFPPHSIFTYYFGKLILYWFLWLSTLGWWFIPALLGSGIILVIAVILIVKYIDK